MNRRSFMALASGLLVPEPTRVYSFAGGWQVRHMVVCLEGSVPIGSSVDWAIADIIRRLDLVGMRPLGNPDDVTVERVPAQPAFDLPHMTLLRIPMLGSDTRGAQT